jgi:hypothetical protein
LPTAAVLNRLNGLDTYNISRTVKLDGVADGTYYLIAKTDAGNSQSETNEDDNTSTLLISLVSADLQANSVSAQDATGNNVSSVDIGRPFNVAWSVSTGIIGSINNPRNDTVYLSKDQVLSSDDKVVLVQSQIKSLNAGDTYTGVATITIDDSKPLPVDANGFIAESTFAESSGKGQTGNSEKIVR